MDDSICAIHQPNLFPRLSTLAKLFSADIYVVLDDVQFTRRDYQHRCRLQQPNAAASQQWLSLPVHLPHGRDTHINDVTIVDGERSRKRVQQLVRQHYGRAPYWPAVRDIVDAAAELIHDGRSLADLGTTSTLGLLASLNWSGTVLHSRQLRARTERSSRLADLTLAAGSHHYLCGSGGARYISEAPFRRAGVRITYYTPPTVPSTPWMYAKAGSALCWLAHLGPDRLTELLTAAVPRSSYQPPAGHTPNKADHRSQAVLWSRSCGSGTRRGRWPVGSPGAE